MRNACWFALLVVCFITSSSGTLRAAPLLGLALEFVDSEPDLSNPYYPSLGSNGHPFKKINGGEFTVTSISDLPEISALVGSPTDLTFSVGSIDDPFGLPVFVLEGFNNGDATGIATAIYQPTPGLTDNAAVFSISGTPVAEAEFLSTKLVTFALASSPLRTHSFNSPLPW